MSAFATTFDVVFCGERYEHKNYGSDFINRRNYKCKRLKPYNTVSADYGEHVVRVEVSGR